MIMIDVIFEAEESRAAAYDGEKLVGICTVPENEDGVWVLDHTVVREEYGGQGLAGLLVDCVTEAARAQNKKILPVCSYAVKRFNRKEDYADVFYKD